jgi:hypothetical protein
LLYPCFTPTLCWLLHGQEKTDSFLAEAGVFAEFVNGEEIPGLFIVPATNSGNDFAVCALLFACDASNVFGIDDSAQKIKIPL